MIIVMKYYLFSTIEFEIPNPVHLIECYCYQSDFIRIFDILWWSYLKAERLKNERGDSLEYG